MLIMEGEGSLHLKNGKKGLFLMLFVDCLRIISSDAVYFT